MVDVVVLPVQLGVQTLFHEKRWREGFCGSRRFEVRCGIRVA